MPISNLRARDIGSTAVLLQWTPSLAQSYRISTSADEGRTFQPVDYGEGPEFIFENRAHDSFLVYGLRPNTKYTFQVFAGNRFVYELEGRNIVAKTLSLKAENGMISLFWRLSPRTFY